MAELDRMLRALVRVGGTDLHLLEGRRPKVRRLGQLEAIQGEQRLDRARLEAMLAELCQPWAWERFQATGELELSYLLLEEGRFRGALYRQATGLGAVFRALPLLPESLADLGAPAGLARLADLRAGLVVVAGPPGSGRTTTLAALLDAINERHARKVVTIEAPVELVHRHERATIVHRQVGEDTASFAAGIRAAARDDTDVLLVGDLRDDEAIVAAVEAAASGLLVLAALVAPSAVRAVDRLALAWPAAERPRARAALASTLRAVVGQRLLRRRDGTGSCAAFELLTVDEDLAAAVRAGAAGRLEEALAPALDDALARLVQQEVIGLEEARARAHDPTRFEAAPAAAGDDVGFDSQLQDEA